jgi:hypothetical protein
MPTRRNVTISLSDRIIDIAKERAGRLPFSRYIENLVIEDLKRGSGGAASESKGDL